MSSEETAQNRAGRKRLGSILRIVFSIAILAFILSRVGLSEVLARLADVNPWLYGLGALVYLSSVLIRAARWRVMLRPMDIDVGLFELARLYLLGFFWDTFLPSGFGGDVVKAIELSRRSSQTEQAVTSVVAERLVGLLGTSLIALVVVLIPPMLVPLWVLAVIGGVSLAILVGGALLRADLLDWLADHLPFLRRVTGHKTVRKFDAALKAYDMRTIAAGVLTSLPFTGALVLVNYLLGLSLGMDIPIAYYLVFVPVVSIVNLLPLSFNGIGVREYMYNLLFGTIVGVGAGQPVALAILFNILRIGVGLLGGVISLIRGTRDLVEQASP
ncbi:MAG: flippase-like domain-containing protein [Chloroflexi bacterium]|nr:flippase-like domain-containing protein [Chloroflexota bacterium]